jgi:formate dehydrogenase iron-sulfur subunit
MGGMTPFPVLSALNHFPEDFGLNKTTAKPQKEAA